MATYTSNKPAVRDSFDDDDVSDDVDDEVFIRDGRNGFKMDEERGAKRPLMAPRRKVKSAPGNPLHTEICKQPQCKAFCVPCCYGLLALVALFGFVLLVVLVINLFPIPLDRIRIWSKSIASREKLVLPCTNIKTQDVWVKTFPKLTSEAALKLNDVNGDNIQDIIVGYGTGADDLGLGEEVCVSYMPGVAPCLGGVMALDGRSGRVLWQHWTHRSVLSVDCSTDITGDSANDCIVSGKGGVLSALNGRDGNVIWELKKPPITEEVDVYAVQFISDVDFDLVPDILTAHSSIQSGRAQGHLLVLSGRTSAVIAQVPTPDHESALTPPLRLVRPDGSDTLLLATGSVGSPGGLYAVPLHHMLQGNISQIVQLVKGGVNDAPVLIDLNRDGTEDIVVISGDKVLAINGLTFSLMWNTTSSSQFGRHQLLNSPTFAYFNDDDIPDLLFTHMVGTSYPEYYFSQTFVVDGSKGTPLLDKPMLSSAFVDSPGIALSLTGSGNDFFLYWVGVCLGHEDTQQRFSFLNSTPIKVRVKADLCKLRFNSTLDLRLYALSQHTAPPGILLYSSEARWGVEHNVTWTAGSAGDVLLEKNKWQQQQQQQQPQTLPQLPLSSFHHKGDSVQHLKAAPHHNHNSYHRQQLDSDQLPVNVDGYERMQPRRPDDEWHPQEPAYGINMALPNRRYSELGMYGNVLNEGLPELDTGYGQEGDEGSLFPPGSLGRDEREDGYQRPRRSVPSRGLPHVGSAGTLTASLDGSGVDVVVTTHWLPSASDVYVRLPRDEQCIQEKLARIAAEKYEDLEALRATVEEECFLMRGVSRRPPTTARSGLSQLTVTRVALACSCDVVSTPVETCATVLPYTRQSWPQRGPGVFFNPHKHVKP